MALILQDWIDVGVIVGLLLVNAIVGFAQEAHAGNIVKELKKTLALKCTVVRNGGTPLEVDAPTLVPGDVVRLEEVNCIYDSKTRRDQTLTCHVLGLHCPCRWPIDRGRRVFAGRPIRSHWGVPRC